MALNMNSVGIPRDFGAKLGFGKIWRLGWFGASKGFCTNSHFDLLAFSLDFAGPLGGQGQHKTIPWEIRRTVVSHCKKRQLQDSDTPGTERRNLGCTAPITGFPENFSNLQGRKSKDSSAGKCYLLYLVVVPGPLRDENQGRKNHDSHRRDRIWRDFLHWIFRYFLQILGGSSYSIAHKYWRKSKKSSGEPPVETAPRNCRFLSLVVVELVLSSNYY